MKLNIHSLLLLSGVAGGVFAQEYDLLGDAWPTTATSDGVSVGFRSQVATTNAAIANAPRLLVEEPVSSVATTTAAATQGFSLSTLFNLKPEDLFPILLKAFPKMNELAVLAALKAVDSQMLWQDYLSPLVLGVMQRVEKINGASIIEWINNFDGAAFLDMLGSLSFQPVVKAISDLQLVPLVKGLIGVDLTTQVQQLQEMNGAAILQFFQDVTVEDAIQWLADRKVFTNLKWLGLDAAPFLAALPDYDSELFLTAVRAFKGKQLVDYFTSLRGPALEAQINTAVNAVLTEVRVAAASAQGLDKPAAFVGFDLTNVAVALQQFINELIGQESPDLLVLVDTFDGARVAEKFKVLQLQDFLDSGLALLNALKMPKNFVAQFASSVQFADSREDFIETALRSFDGTKFLETIANLDLTPYAQVLSDLAFSPVAQTLTDVDLTPYFETFRQFDGYVFLRNVEVLEGERLVQLLVDLGAVDYMSVFDYQPLLETIRSLKGSVILEGIRSFDYEQYAALRNLASSTATTPDATVLPETAQPAVLGWVDEVLPEVNQTVPLVAAVSQSVQIVPRRVVTGFKVAVQSTQAQATTAVQATVQPVAVVVRPRIQTIANTNYAAQVSLVPTSATQIVAPAATSRLRVLPVANAASLVRTVAVVQPLYA